MRIGPRDTACANVCSITGHVLPWVTELRYLDVFIVRSKNFKCSLDTAKRSLYRAANAIFGKVGRIASEAVTLQLFSSKCIPLLLYGLESFPLSSSQLASLDFIINRFFMKLFKTNNIDTVEACQSEFGFKLPTTLLACRNKILCKVNQCDNYMLRLFRSVT